MYKRQNIANLNRTLSFNNFYTSLTPKEKEYLEKLPPIRVAYETKTNSLVSYKSEIDGKYKGIAPNIFNILQNNLNIDFIDVTNIKESTINNLKNNDFDVMVLSKTQKRS